MWFVIIATENPRVHEYHTTSNLSLNFLLKEITVMSKCGHLISMSTRVGIEHGSPWQERKLITTTLPRPDVGFKCVKSGHIVEITNKYVPRGNCIREKTTHVPICPITQYLKCLKCITTSKLSITQPQIKFTDAYKKNTCTHIEDKLTKFESRFFPCTVGIF